MHRWRAGVLVAVLAGGVGAAENTPHGELSLDCGDCHTESGWRPLRRPLGYDHATSGFPLVAAHRRLDCLACHESLVFSHVASACADCHDDAHRGELGFGCDDCHRPAGWSDRRRMLERHNRSLFPLKGGHAVADCEGCHREGPPFEFVATPIECLACHESEYAATTTPNHVLAGFGTRCELCHDPSSWRARGFPGHDALFPINSGAHREAWSQCTDCHTGLPDFLTFDCTVCHEHRQSLMDSAHADVAGYAYESTACLACHPNGRVR